MAPSPLSAYITDCAFGERKPCADSFEGQAVAAQKSNPTDLIIGQMCMWMFRTTDTAPGATKRAKCMKAVVPPRTPFQVICMIIRLNSVLVIDFLSRLWISVKGECHQAVNVAICDNSIPAQMHTRVSRWGKSWSQRFLSLHGSVITDLVPRESEDRSECFHWGTSLVYNPSCPS